MPRLITPPATFVLIPGAGGSALYWHLTAPELAGRGHEAVAVDLPAADDAAGLDEYVDVVVQAIDRRSEIVILAQSMAGLTGPMVCARVRVELLVMLNAMIPSPGESGADWWVNTGHAAAARAEHAEHSEHSEHSERSGHAEQGGPDVYDGDDDMFDAFFHDVPPAVIATMGLEPTRHARRSSRNLLEGNPVMIIVSGHLTVDPGDRAAYLDQCREAIEAARQAPGCLDFHLAADPLDESRINVYEAWETLNDVEAFRGGGPDAAQMSMIRSAAVRQHDVASSIDLT